MNTKKKRGTVEDWTRIIAKSLKISICLLSLSSSTSSLPPSYDSVVLIGFCCFCYCRAVVVIVVVAVVTLLLLKKGKVRLTRQHIAHKNRYGRTTPPARDHAPSPSFDLCDLPPHPLSILEASRLVLVFSIFICCFCGCCCCCCCHCCWCWCGCWCCLPPRLTKGPGT